MDRERLARAGFCWRDEHAKLRGQSATRPTAGTQARDGKRLPAVSTATRTRELAHAGLTMFNVENTSIWEKDRRQHQDQVNVWIAWLDWEVRFVRLSWEANVTTWNLGPLGYEYSRSQLQQLLTKGQQPEYYCFL